MKYQNTGIKIDAFVSYCNEDKINLSPAFQRGHVWDKKQRMGLLKNILGNKPIPAIFLYKQASGTRFTYNILDGKQRLESIILFINSSGDDLQIPRWKDYFFNSQAKSNGGFSAEYLGKQYSFDNLPDDAIRELREYSIPTIEITLDDDTNLDEVISLFVDINQQGEKVTRFNIVKAMCDNSPILKSTFNLIAIKQTRGKDTYYKMKNNDITSAFKYLRDIFNEKENNRKVDKIWEKLIDIIQYIKTSSNKKPSEVLKTFLNQKATFDTKITLSEEKKLRRTCKFIGELAKGLNNEKNPLIYDYTHFYTLISLLVKSNLVNHSNKDAMLPKFIEFGHLLEKKKIKDAKKKIAQSYKQYRDASLQQTGDPSQREIRSRQMEYIIKNL